jgi:hypothetical protein
MSRSDLTDPKSGPEEEERKWITVPLSLYSSTHIHPLLLYNTLPKPLFYSLSHPPLSLSYPLTYHTLSSPQPSNEAGLQLYTKTLGYSTFKTMKGYYTEPAEDGKILVLYRLLQLRADAAPVHETETETEKEADAAKGWCSRGCCCSSELTLTLLLQQQRQRHQ